MQISHSAKETYTTCPYKYYLHYMRRFRPIGKRSSLEFGSCVDEGLNVLLETKDLDNAIAVFNEKWAGFKHSALTYSKADTEEFLLKEVGYKPVSIMDAAWTSLSLKGPILLTEYAQQILPRIKEVIKVQVVDEMVNDDGDTLTVKGDFIAVWENGQTILFDNKTSSIKYKEDSVKKSAQLGIYYEILKDKYKIDACGYIALPKKINKNKLPRVKIDVIIDQVDPEIIDLALAEFDWALGEIKGGRFPKNEKSCISVYGKCEYFEYCKNKSCAGLKEVK